MLEKIARSMTDHISDDMMEKLLTNSYEENLYVMWTAAKKLTADATVEACMRGETGEVLKRPYGSPNVQSPWKLLFLNPVQLFMPPTADQTTIQTKVVIGKQAKKPMEISMPIMLTGMSYGGSLSLKIKKALAKAASEIGTATNTGESVVTDEERETAKLLIGQYNRYGLMTEEDLSRVDAIEIQLGQGAWGGGVPGTKKSDTIHDHLRIAWRLKEGEDANRTARLERVESKEDLINFIHHLREQYGVPVGIKIAASHYIEKDLEVIADTEADFICIDGAEGGTAVAPPTLSDCVGLPTIYGLARASAYMETHGLRERMSLIAAGGLRTPGEFLKALALGADAVYIGSIALVAALQRQMTEVTPFQPTPQLFLYDGKSTEQFDEERGARTLLNFLRSCDQEMQLTLRALGKSDINTLDMADLVCVDPLLADGLGIAYAGLPLDKRKI